MAGPVDESNRQNPSLEHAVFSKRLTVTLVAAFCVIASACSDSNTTGTNSTTDSFPGVTQSLTLDLNQLSNYANPAYPVHYDAQARNPDNTPTGNPVTDRGATLGRVLFHDTQLSINNTKSCASCHGAGNGFTDAARFSVGFDGAGKTTAHAMRLANARFYGPGDAFWDKRAVSLEAQSTQPIQNAVEMGFDASHGGIAALITRMKGLAYYPELFKFVYGDENITEDRMQRAIAQYVRSIVSVDSKFDQGFTQVYNAPLPDRGLNAPFPVLTAQENRGKQLFLQPPQQGGAGCQACHAAPTFALTGNSRSNGLDAGETKIFKSPSLKNVAVTGPYMHDGRFTTLAQVVQHYVGGIQDGPALDQRLRGPGGQPQRLQLSADDKAALVAFLGTLTDNTVATDKRFSDPFKR
jgi:cytochrome c peroxidase